MQLKTALIERAEALARTAHAGQVDKGGVPYIQHPLHVAAQMETEAEIVTALLHDVVEDTDWTIEGLGQAGYPKEILEALALLTHEDGVPYFDYVRTIKPNPLARRVKLADLAHNSDLSRLPTVGEKELRRVAKYQEAIRILTEE